MLNLDTRKKLLKLCLVKLSLGTYSRADIQPERPNLADSLVHITLIQTAG